MSNSQQWSPLPELELSAAKVIRSPEQPQPGYWVGAPGVCLDADSGLVYLTYRVRRPRGVESDRGAEVHLAVSSDGREFETIWTGTKEQLSSPSIERCGLRKIAGEWVLYLSFVDHRSGKWRIEATTAATPDGFDLSRRRPLLTPEPLGVDGVKDPFLFEVAGGYHMLVSFAQTVGSSSDEALHGTQDAYNTGLIRSATGLASSQDGLHWQWHGEVFGPGAAEAWDAYCGRIGSIWRSGGLWLALYDGSASVAENYEERVGVAYGETLREFRRVTDRHPWLSQSPGALRYFDTIEFGGERLFYFEQAQPDGSHDLRVLSAGATTASAG